MAVCLGFLINLRELKTTFRRINRQNLRTHNEGKFYQLIDDDKRFFIKS